jgi:peptidoglycan/LPS O-acetylase OafA/YrhL
MANADGPFWVAMTWSLSVEEQFYLIFPFIAMLFGRKGLLFATLVAIIVAPIIRHWAFDSFGFYGGYMLFPARMDSIAMGVLVAFVVRNEKIFSFLLKSNSVYLIPFTLFFLLTERIDLGGYILDSFTFRGLFYASIIAILVIKKNLFITWFFENKVILFFWSISFGLYMYHQLISGLFHGIAFNRAPRIDSFDSFILSLFVFLVAIIISVISLKYFETPIRNYFKNKSNKLSINA